MSISYYPLKPIKFKDLRTRDFTRVGLTAHWEGKDYETWRVTYGRSTMFLHGNILDGSLYVLRWFAPNAQYEHFEIELLIFALAAALKCDIRAEYESVYYQPNTIATLS
jgi:hypothetical protein